LEKWTSGIVTKLQNNRPLVRNCLVLGTLSGLAEFSQQTLLYKVFPCKEDRKNYDLAAVGRYMTLGSFLFAPTLHYWFKWLDKVLPGKTAEVVLKKVVVDAVVLDVPYYIAFYMAMGTMEGKSFSSSWEDVKAKLVKTLIYALILWIPAQAVNFRFVPPHMRVTYIACVTFIELNMLAIMKRIPRDDCVLETNVEHVKKTDDINNVNNVEVLAALPTTAAII